MRGECVAEAPPAGKLDGSFGIRVERVEPDTSVSDPTGLQFSVCLVILDGAHLDERIKDTFAIQHNRASTSGPDRYRLAQLLKACACQSLDEFLRGGGTRIATATIRSGTVIAYSTAPESVANVAAVADTPLEISITAPEPLRRSMPEALEYPSGALGPTLGDAVDAIHDVVQSPRALAGQSVLAAASLAAQAHADVLIDGRREPLSLWSVTVGESGERKSAGDTWALREHRAYEREQLERFLQERADHEIVAAAFDMAKRQASNKKGADAIRTALEELGPEPCSPLQPLLLVNEPTLEGLQKLFERARPSIGLFSDDAGDFLGGHSMNKENKIKSVAGFSRLWDAGEFSRVRSGDGAVKVFGKRLAMHLMIQPVIAETVFSDEILTGQGFLARCLMAWPKSTVGGRTYVERDLSSDRAMLAYWRTTRQLLEMPPILRPGSRNELEPRTMTLTSTAKRLWVDAQNELERCQAPTGAFAMVRAWASKAGAQILRIAGVITLVENSSASTIQYEAIERARLLTLHHINEAARIVGTSAVPTQIRHAEAILRWCQETSRTLVYSRDALRLGPNAIRTLPAFNAAMKVLEDSGSAIPIKGGCVLDGSRRRKVWKVHTPH